MNWDEFINQERELLYFYNLEKFILEERKTKTIFPKEEDVFNVFKLTPFENVKCVIVGQDPYYNINQANGLAFSVNKGIKLPPSLVNIYKEAHDDELLRDYSGLLNRLSGLADEMSSYFRRLKHEQD